MCASGSPRDLHLLRNAILYTRHLGLIHAEVDETLPVDLVRSSPVKGGDQILVEDEGNGRSPPTGHLGRKFFSSRKEQLSVTDVLALSVNDFDVMMTTRDENGEAERETLPLLLERAVSALLLGVGGCFL